MTSLRWHLSQLQHFLVTLKRGQKPVDFSRSIVHLPNIGKLLMLTHLLALMVGQTFTHRLRYVVGPAELIKPGWVGTK